MTNPIEAGFSQKVISPEKGVSLCGYFNNRYNRGIHDDLLAKTMVVSDGRTRGALVVADNAIIYTEVVRRLRAEIAPRTGIAESNIFVQATHTHTAPALKAGGWVDFSPAYLDHFVAQVTAAAVEASDAVQPVTFAIAEAKAPPVAFCRRFIMRDGTVATNPPKDSPDIVRPEGTPDDYFAVVAVRNLSGEIVAVLVHCTNHVDTVGGDLVSADWPGVLCRQVTDNVDAHPYTILINGMAGNVNHRDIKNPEEQYGFAEAERIGAAYAEKALELLRTEPRPLDAAAIAFGRTLVDLPRLELTEHQIGKARAILETTPIPDELPLLHSVDIAKSNEIVAALFAREQLKFAAENIASQPAEVAAMRIGNLLLIGLPFEPFSEIGVEIRRRSPFKHTFALGLLNGKGGYLGTREAAERQGGMETFPGVDCLRCFVPEAADMLTDAAAGLANSLAEQGSSDKK